MADEGWVMCKMCGNWTKPEWYVAHIEERHVKPAERQLERAIRLLDEIQFRAQPQVKGELK